MRRILTVAFCLAVMPALVGAQQWSAAQKEVLDFEQSCWADQTAQSNERCFHEDFQGWGVDSTVPTSRADRKMAGDRSRATEDQVYLFLKPVAITVHGDMATALYIATYTMKNKTTGVETTVTERWTDVLVKDGGRWSWIADHGINISND